MTKLTTIENTEYGIKRINLALCIEYAPNSYEFKQLDEHFTLSSHISWDTRRELAKCFAKHYFVNFKTSIELRENVKIEGVM
jgi:hypothetical protein